MLFSSDGIQYEHSATYHFHEPALPEDQLTSERQRQRRARILDAAVTVAAAGGYDRVHVRDIADLAKVSLATLYHYFPSKVHVLVWALDRELMRFDDDLAHRLAQIQDPFARLRIVVWRLVKAMEHSDRVTEAMTHAYVASSMVASAEAEMIRVQTSKMFAHLMSDGAVDELHRNTADVLTDVWTSEILALVQGRRTFDEVHRRLHTVIDLIARANEPRCEHGETSLRPPPSRRTTP
ncbi:TetR family transcriptional regulator [Mycobacterium yunnanensis]|uniref:TetR family transcriptional regulator n=1 Tax=Mycobacterium yunnanensis TaxID=368477 RepID=A0A9X2Z7M3_9MYCO|nr:TetR family transcriptional regulator [Mycobacterium yunnanensis]MCV7423796.1 TetR family transcriptional regulator [Mycobacterium yunnanensis]